MIRPSFRFPIPAMREPSPLNPEAGLEASYTLGVTTSFDNTPICPDPGLCRNCRHARRIESDRGSTFLMCKLSFEDSRFAKYPRLPVLVCRGYRPATEEPPAQVD